MVRHLLFIDRKNATSRGWYICFELGGKQQKVILRSSNIFNTSKKCDVRLSSIKIHRPLSFSKRAGQLSETSPESKYYQTNQTENDYTLYLLVYFQFRCFIDF